MAPKTRLPQLTTSRLESLRSKGVDVAPYITLRDKIQANGIGRSQMAAAQVELLAMKRVHLLALGLIASEADQELEDGAELIE